MFSNSFRVLLLAFAALLLVTCGDEPDPGQPASAPVSDSELATMVEAAIAGASDLPADLSVEVNAGVVTVSGSLACPECGGQRTPGTLGTVQQSLGAVIRAVPGVGDVQFSLSVRNQ